MVQASERTRRQSMPGFGLQDYRSCPRRDDRALSATLIDSETTRDFISLLPLTLTPDHRDLFRSPSPIA